LDKDSFISHVTKNRRRWLYMAKSMLPERDCEDALQSSILSAWEHLPQLKDERAFDAWFRQILINRCRQMQRGYKRDQDILHALSENGIAHERSELHVDEAMEHLKAEDRNLIRLHHEQGYSLKEISESTGYSEDVLKMRLYRARKRLKVALITLPLMLLLTVAAAIGAGLININWFLQNRRVEPVSTGPSAPTNTKEFTYAGEELILELNDAVWNPEKLSLAFVYSIAGKGEECLFVHSDNIGVDGERLHHIWMDQQILPVTEWAGGKNVKVFSMDVWKTGDQHLRTTEDSFPEGNGEVFYTEVFLDTVDPDQYKALLDENGRLTFTTTLTLEEYSSGTVLESETMTLRVKAPSAAEWRTLYEAYLQ